MADSAPHIYYLELSSLSRHGRRFTRLKARSVLDWFRKYWRGAARGKTIAVGPWIDQGVYGLEGFHEAIREGGLACPDGDDELLRFMGDHIDVEGDLVVEPHFVHFQTGVCDSEFEYYFFDDAFLQESRATQRLPDPGSHVDDYYMLVKDARSRVCGSGGANPERIR